MARASLYGGASPGELHLHYLAITYKYPVFFTDYHCKIAVKMI